MKNTTSRTYSSSSFVSAFTPIDIATKFTSTIHKDTASTSSILKAIASSGDVSSTTSTDDVQGLENTSTLTLLEHVNLNIPNHDYIDFYLSVLGMGLDPRRGANVEKGSGTIWANCGASQFHLPYGKEGAQVIPGCIGLWYDDLSPLKTRLSKYDNDDDNEKTKKPFAQYSVGIDEHSGKEHIRIMDNYGNIFFCREGTLPSSSGDDDEKELIHTAKQPILSKMNEQHVKDFPSSVMDQYGLNQDAECKGISYVEFYVPPNTANKIAEFYDCVFDAPTNVFPGGDDGNDIAIVGFGSIDPTTGRTSQSILFRESSTMDIPPYDGHHIALYVGQNQADFEQAFKNCEEAGIVWVNPRFSDKVTNLNTAKKWKQFRMKDILDLKTGRKIFELEHEVRCVHHDAWPGGDL